MIETRCSFCFPTKARQGLGRIGVITENAFERDDAPRELLSCAINHTHSAARGGAMTPERWSSARQVRPVISSMIRNAPPEPTVP